jgi:hypothetical protein
VSLLNLVITSRLPNFYGLSSSKDGAPVQDIEAMTTENNCGNVF